MKILCETQIINRETQTTKGVRNAKSTLAIGYKESPKDSNGNSCKELEIVLFTTQNKRGTRYKVNKNIEKVYTKFVLDGKATISFRQPPDNILIKCDPIQLKGFLSTLKLGMEGKDSINLRLNIAAASAVPQKSQPQKRMFIGKRSDYPVKGFPKSLLTLTVSNIQLHKIGYEIWSLPNLTVLNLGYNSLSKLPTELGRLPLYELQLNNNLLGANSNWEWLNGIRLRNSLRELNLTNNNLNNFPMPLIKCEKLVKLTLNNNNLKHLPFGLRRLRNLRYLNLCSNKLESLPAIFDGMIIENLDLWDNNFQTLIEHNLDAQKISRLQNSINSVTPLWLLASRSICKYKISYPIDTLPEILEDLLKELPKCSCGKLCFGNQIFERAVMARFGNVKNMVFSRNRHVYEDIVLCGPKCLGKRRIFSETIDPVYQDDNYDNGWIVEHRDV